LGWWDWDCKTGEVFTHSNKWKMLGYSMEDVTPMIEWWQSLIHPEDRERVIATLYRHLRGESDEYDAEYRLRTKTGEWRWVSDRGKVVLKDTDQTPLRISGTTQDITGRKIALDELLREKFLSETTINSLPGSFYMVDERFKIVRWNRNMEIDSGYSGAELAQLNPFALIAWEDRKRTTRSITQLMNEGSYSVEAEIVTKAGKRIPCYLSGNLMKFDGKKYVIGMGIDISQRKQLEEDLKQAKEAAETANHAKSTFLTNLSHEIRTPMNAILGFSQLMLRDPGITALQRRHLDTINRSGDHLMALINDVLELSKIEAGRIEFKPALFKLNELIDDLEVIFRLQTNEKHLSFRVEKESTLPDNAVADANKLRQIFINLLANSVKFTLTGGITWRLHSEAGQAGCLHLISEIEDSGPGMDAAELARLFHPFEQTSSGEQAGSGTGLGLNISREFAQRMGGDIWVTSQLGKGSVFHLEVTLCQASPDRPNPEHKPRKVIGLRPGQGPYRVLIADDQENNRILLAEMLQMVGFETRQAATAEEAMPIFQSWRPHLILVEINMPVPPHYRARMERGSGTQMMAVTTSAFENDRVQILETGFAGYVRKPFKEDELFAAIADCLGAEYIYQPETGQDAATENPASCDPGGDELSALPVEWLEKLEHAIISANLKQLVSLIDQYTPAMPHAAGHLRELAENYRYEKLLDLLRQRKT
jgi:two-component system CheB/CheR fusion protein